MVGKKEDEEAAGGSRLYTLHSRMVHGAKKIRPEDERRQDRRQPVSDTTVKASLQCSSLELSPDREQAIKNDKR